MPLSYGSLFSKHKEDVTYYPGGSIKTVSKYYIKNNKKILDGASKSYFSSGGVQRLLTYKNGILDGVAKEYYPSRYLKWKGRFIQGEKSDVWIFYDQSENKRMSGKFKEGLLQALTYYYPNGKKKRKEVYQGKNLIHFTTWDKYGNKRADKKRAPLPNSQDNKNHNIFTNLFSNK